MLILYNRMKGDSPNGEKFKCPTFMLWEPKPSLWCIFRWKLRRFVRGIFRWLS